MIHGVPKITSRNTFVLLLRNCAVLKRRFNFEFNSSDAPEVKQKFRSLVIDGIGAVGRK